MKNERHSVMSLIPNFLLIFMILLTFFSQCSASDVKLRKKIIIDPMYGGTESGPIGYNKIKGKDITLEISQIIAKLLNEAGYDVILTRDKDTTINSKKRIHIANKNNGDIFVGIGINCSADKKVSGVETFFLEYQQIGTIKVPESVDKKIAQQIIDDLSLKENVISSKYLAQYLSETVSKDLDIKNLGTKKAPIESLFNLAMPSAIIYIDYISNNEVTNNLSIPKYRSRVADSITKAIMKYFDMKKKKLTGSPIKAK